MRIGKCDNRAPACLQRSFSIIAHLFGTETSKVRCEATYISNLPPHPVNAAMGLESNGILRLSVSARHIAAWLRPRAKPRESAPGKAMRGGCTLAHSLLQKCRLARPDSITSLAPLSIFPGAAPTPAGLPGSSHGPSKVSGRSHQSPRLGLSPPSWCR